VQWCFYRCRHLGQLSLHLVTVVGGKAVIHKAGTPPLHLCLQGIREWDILGSAVSPAKRMPFCLAACLMVEGTPNTNSPGDLGDFGQLAFPCLTQFPEA
jgi:hypothetical protein